MESSWTVVIWEKISAGDNFVTNLDMLPFGQHPVNNHSGNVIKLYAASGEEELKRYESAGFTCSLYLSEVEVFCSAPYHQACVFDVLFGDQSEL